MQALQAAAGVVVVVHPGGGPVETPWRPPTYTKSYEILCNFGSNMGQKSILNDMFDLWRALRRIRNGFVFKFLWKWWYPKVEGLFLSPFHGHFCFSWVRTISLPGVQVLSPDLFSYRSITQFWKNWKHRNFEQVWKKKLIFLGLIRDALGGVGETFSEDFGVFSKNFQNIWKHRNQQLTKIRLA